MKIVVKIELNEWAPAKDVLPIKEKVEKAISTVAEDVSVGPLFIGKPEIDLVL